MDDEKFVKMEKQKIIESLSKNEIKIIPYLEKWGLEEISEKVNLDKVSVLRALEYLQNKNIIKLTQKKSGSVDLDMNGTIYLKNGLPERQLMNVLKDKRVLSIKEAKKLSSLSDEEMKASIGILKKRSIIDLKNNNIHLNTNEEEITKKTEEEIFIESLPSNYGSLSKLQLRVLKNLLARKNIIKIIESKKFEISVTSFGKEITSMKIKDNFIEQITPKILTKDSYWKDKKFRRYDISAKVPKIHGGKLHFINQAADYGRKIWTDMGFKEMNGDLIVSSFWNFDALFTAQDHPVREMQDTFFMSKEIKKSEFIDKEISKNVKKSHEGTLSKAIGSKGWGYKWDNKEAKKLILRTHTTVLSAKTLAKIKKDKLNLPQKFFALGRCFRNETVDWSHGFEFNQTEGIVVDKKANFRHLLGYLKQFFEKMGFEKIRFRPAYFPYTEPSVEIDVYHKEKKKWLELGGAGIFRPEVVVPLLGENIPVLAWGPGFDRMVTDYYKIKDIRELYKNDISHLRKIKPWMKS